MTDKTADLVLIEARPTDALCRAYCGTSLLEQVWIDPSDDGLDATITRARAALAADQAQVIAICSDVQNLNKVPAKATPEIIGTSSNAVLLKGFAQAQPPAILTQGSVQIFGYLDKHPDFDGVLCIAEDQSSWVRISAGETVSFASFATGEVYRAYTGDECAPDAGASFLEGVEQGYGKPAKFAERINSIRAAQVLNGLSQKEAQAQIFGILVGVELASARPYWLGMPVVVIGDDAPARAYQAALKAQGAPCEIYDGHTARMDGIAKIRDTMAQT